MAAKKKKRGWIALIVILVILALPPVAVWYYAKTCAFDIDAVRAEQTAVTETVSPAIDGGSVSVFYSPARVYELVGTDGINGIWDEALGGALKGAVRLDTFAVEPHDGMSDVYARVTLFGLLPVTLRAEADVTAQNSDIGVWIESLDIGTKFSVPIEKIGLSRSVTLTPSAPVDGISVSADGYTVSYRFLQEHFLSDLKGNAELLESYTRFCPEAAAIDETVRLWNENASLSGSKLCSTVGSREELTRVLALAVSSGTDNFLRTMSAFERDTLFPGAQEAIAGEKRRYLDETADAYRALSEEADTAVSFADDRRFYVADGSVMLRARRIRESTPVDIAAVMTDCSLLSPAESRYVLLYWTDAPVPPASTDGQTFKNLEAKDLRTSGMLLLKAKQHYAPALVTRFAGSLPCLLYRGADGELVLNELTEETYVSLMEDAGLLLLDDLQTGSGSLYGAPAGCDGLPGYRIIRLPQAD